MSDAPPPFATSTGPSAPPGPSADTAPKPHISTMAETNGVGSGTPVGAHATSSATEDRAGGAQARVYLNDKIVPHLLEGMKSVAREKPADPLRVLGEFLIQRSSEVERDIKKEPE